MPLRATVAVAAAVIVTRSSDDVLFVAGRTISAVSGGMRPADLMIGNAIIWPDGRSDGDRCRFQSRHSFGRRSIRDGHRT